MTKEQKKIYQKEYYLTKELPRRQRRKLENGEDYRKHKENTLRSNLKVKYSLSLEQYNALLKKQKGVCAVCHNPPIMKMGVMRLAVDHDHQTNEVRGLLCHTCNAGIGNLKDSISLLRAAVKYLQR